MIQSGIISLRIRNTLDHVPQYLDVRSGYHSPATGLDGGRAEKAIKSRAGGFRVTKIFASRKHLHENGLRSLDYAQDEHDLGLSRTYKVELRDKNNLPEVIKSLRDLEEVEDASPVHLVTSPLIRSEYQDQRRRFYTARILKESMEQPLRQIGALRALEMEPGDARIRVAVVDTGVSLGHREFRGKLLSGYDTVDLGQGALSHGLKLVGDSFGHDHTPEDETSHGSHVASIIGSLGQRMYRGAGGRCMILPIRVLAAALALEGDMYRRTGIGASTDIDAGIKMAVDLGAHVINLSLGTPGSSIDPESEPPHQQAVRYASAKGCVLVAASGNNGQKECFYPACLPDVIAVGSVDSNGNRSEFSTYGSHIALCAPGEKILGAGRKAYRYSTGTSHAAPFVAAGAALLLSRAMRRRSHLSARDIRYLLTTSANAGENHRQANEETGYGTLNLPRSLALLDKKMANGGLNNHA